MSAVWWLLIAYAVVGVVVAQDVAGWLFLVRDVAEDASWQGQALAVLACLAITAPLWPLALAALPILKRMSCSTRRTP